MSFKKTVEKLKPCAHCGSRAVFRSRTRDYHNEITHRIMCAVCNIKTTIYSELYKAIEVWNKRVGDE